jgi:hypothetical protein
MGAGKSRVISKIDPLAEKQIPRFARDDEAWGLMKLTYWPRIHAAGRGQKGNQF